MRDVFVMWAMSIIITSCLVLSAYMLGLRLGAKECSPTPKIHQPHTHMRYT